MVPHPTSRIPIGTNFTKPGGKPPVKRPEQQARRAQHDARSVARDGPPVVQAPHLVGDRAPLPPDLFAIEQLDLVGPHAPMFAAVVNAGPGLLGAGDGQRPDALHPQLPAGRHARRRQVASAVADMGQWSAAVTNSALCGSQKTASSMSSRGEQLRLESARRDPPRHKQSSDTKE
ncbi:hypothetical protein GCM10023322_33100 [Rugosimonospora acidiphila]|uniref:Uncharacterized protein n=1 Tax=Rugosimonospora acidiphila TaxID=556531 RepID=A0ABP9RUB4_9ACTN